MFKKRYMSLTHSPLTSGLIKRFIKISSFPIDQKKFSKVFQEKITIRRKKASVITLSIIFMTDKMRRLNSAHQRVACMYVYVKKIGTLTWVPTGSTQYKNKYFTCKFCRLQWSKWWLLEWLVRCSIVQFKSLEEREFLRIFLWLSCKFGYVFSVAC